MPGPRPVSTYPWSGLVCPSLQLVAIILTHTCTHTMVLLLPHCPAVDLQHRPARQQVHESSVRRTPAQPGSGQHVLPIRPATHQVTTPAALRHRALPRLHTRRGHHGLEPQHRNAQQTPAGSTHAGSRQQGPGSSKEAPPACQTVSSWRCHHTAALHASAHSIAAVGTDACLRVCHQVWQQEQGQDGTVTGARRVSRVHTHCPAGMSGAAGTRALRSANRHLQQLSGSRRRRRQHRQQRW